MDVGKPVHTASGSEFMLPPPIDCASFNNEFGIPVLADYRQDILTKVQIGDGEEDFI